MDRRFRVVRGRQASVFPQNQNLSCRQASEAGTRPDHAPRAAGGRHNTGVGRRGITCRPVPVRGSGAGCCRRCGYCRRRYCVSRVPPPPVAAGSGTPSSATSPSCKWAAVAMKVLPGRRRTAHRYPVWPVQEPTSELENVPVRRSRGRLSRHALCLPACTFSSSDVVVCDELHAGFKPVIKQI